MEYTYRKDDDGSEWRLGKRVKWDRWASSVRARLRWAVRKSGYRLPRTRFVILDGLSYRPGRKPRPATFY